MHSFPRAFRPFNPKFPVSLHPLGTHIQSQAFPTTTGCTTAHSPPGLTCYRSGNVYTSTDRARTKQPFWWACWHFYRNHWTHPDNGSGESLCGPGHLYRAPASESPPLAVPQSQRPDLERVWQ